jgi:hypothetical protein
LAEELRVISEISQKPIQFPEGPLGAVEPTRESSSGNGSGLKDYEAERKKGLLRMPAVASLIDADEEEALKRAIVNLFPGIEAWNMASHDFTSAG